MINPKSLILIFLCISTDLIGMQLCKAVVSLFKKKKVMYLESEPDLWQLLPAELQGIIMQFIIEDTLQKEYSFSRCIFSIKNKRIVSRQFRDCIDSKTPFILEKLIAQYKDTHQILTIGYNSHCFNAAKKFGTQAAQEWIEMRKEEIIQEDKLFEAIEEDNLAAVKQLIEQKVNINAFYWVMETPLNYAIERKKSADLIIYLLKNKANPNLQDVNGHTPLFGAIENPELITLLLQHGADPNVIDNCRMTPLLCATDYTRIHGKKIYECIKLLLEAGADSSREDKKGYTALDYAIFSPVDPIAELLRSFNAERGSNYKLRMVPYSF
jgi:hypothetical protein